MNARSQEPDTPASLEARIEALRAVLAGLLQEVARAESLLENSRAAQLVEANERLVLAAMRNQTFAESASQALDEVTRAASLDALTQLPNRAVLLDRIGGAIAHAKRHSTSMAVLFLDLNQFKQINDTLGHAAGDEVLKFAARCLDESVRDADTVSRHGGDEFLVLLPEVAHAADAAIVAGKILAALGRPHRWGDHVLRVGASIGISIYPDDATDAQSLIRLADAAMYQAKRIGAGGFAFHSGPAPGDVAPAPPPKALQGPLTDFERARAEHDRRYAQLQEANEQLLLAVLDARGLQAAAEDLIRRQNESMTMVVHELRNPIAPIRMAALMIGRLRSEEPTLARAHGIIERQIKQMAHLVNDLLDVARVKTGKLSVSRDEVDLLRLVDDAIEAARPAMDTHLQSLEIQVPSQAVMLNADPARITQVLSNLLNNASKYTPDGGLIALKVTASDDAVVVSVSDNGIGIPAEVLPHVFDPFVQDPRAAEFSKVGLGVGLTVVLEIVKAHGGTVVATSPGRGLGSEFVVTLPRTGEAVG